MRATQTAPTSLHEALAAQTVALRDGVRATVMERYRLVRTIGSGGFGTVWEAFDEKLKRPVALKEIVTGLSGGRREQRARQEAQAAAKLSHPNIVSLYEYGREGEHAYLISELIEGATFDDLLSKGVLTDRQIARIGIEICDALEHAHKAGVIHRDIKPQNVLIAESPLGDEDEGSALGPAKLMDFGVAHVAAGDRLTATGDVIGTLVYMAPEQAQGKPASESVDTYSLVLSLYEAWTGSNPVQASTPAATLDRVGSRIKSLGRARRDLPDELVAAVDQALLPRPEQRLELEDLRAALEGSLPELDDEEGLGPTAGPAPMPLLGSPRSRTLRWLPRAVYAASLGGAVVLASLLAGGAVAGSDAVIFAIVAALIGYFLPRLAWIAAVGAALVVVVGAQFAGSGDALFLAAAALPVPFLLSRHGRLWTTAALAPLTGALGVAPAYMGCLAFTRRAPARAALGAIGFWWLALVEVVTGSTLLYGPPLSSQPASAWRDSISDAFSSGLLPLLTSSLILTAVLWSVFALALPVIVRGRSLVLDTLGGAIWAVALVVSSKALGEALVGEVARPDPRGILAGAVTGALMVVTLSHLRRKRV